MPLMLDAIQSISLRSSAFSKQSILNGLISAVFGALFGVFLSLSISCVLLQVGVNTLIAYYFALSFGAVGCGLFWRVRFATDLSFQRQYYLSYCSFAMIGASISCFVIRGNAFGSMEWILKFPMFALLGGALCFAVAFSLIDVINLSSRLHNPSGQRPLIDTLAQVQLVLSSSVLIGVVCGCIFGLSDVESANLSGRMHILLFNSQKLCLPLGLLLGGLVGFTCHIVSIESKSGYTKNSMSLDVFDNEL